MDILDRNIVAFGDAYDVCVTHAEELVGEIVDWFAETHQGGTPSDDQIQHVIWRCTVERDQYKTPRAALQSVWPKPEPSRETWYYHGTCYVERDPAGKAIGVVNERGDHAEAYETSNGTIAVADWSLTGRVEGEELRWANGTTWTKTPQSTVVRLVAEGQHLRGADGSRFTARCNTDFRLLKNWLDGVDIAPVVDQRLACGSNMVRVLGTCDYMFRLYPQEYPQYFDQVPRFREWLEARGLYLQFTAFADATRVMPNVDDQLAFWARVGATLGGSAALVELVNENDQTINRIDAGRFPRLSNVLCSHGSNGSQAMPVEPHWDFATFHTNASSEEQRKIGHNAMEIWGGPTLTNETSRYPDVGMWVGWPLDRQKVLAYDSAAGAALQCVGYCFHSVHGKQSEMWDANEEAIAREMARGALSVPLEFQDGGYVRRDDLTWQPQPPPPPFGQVLRAYERRLGDGRGHVVLIHA